MAKLMVRKSQNSLMSVLAGSNAGVAGSAGFRVDFTRGARVGRVSSECFSRPDEERYLSLSALYEAVRARADKAAARTVESGAIRVKARRDDGERLALIVPGQERPVAPTHWSFGQLCGLVLEVIAHAPWRAGGARRLGTDATVR